MKLVIGADHAGWGLKEHLKKAFQLSFLDIGTHGPESVDYPDFAEEVARVIQNHQATRGVLICGSGIGMSIAANRFLGIRAALCTSELEVRLARQHNDANILCLGARVVGESQAEACLSVFLTTDFEGERHQRRIDKIKGGS